MLVSPDLPGVSVARLTGCYIYSIRISIRIGIRIVEGFAFVPPRHFFQDLGWPKNCLVFVMGHEADGKLIDVWVGIGWLGFRVRGFLI